VSGEQTLLKHQLQLQFGCILEWGSLKYSDRRWQLGTLLVGFRGANNTQISTATAVGSFQNGNAKNTLADVGNSAHCWLVSREQTMLKYELWSGLEMLW
jgi:hypothetical protein